LYGGLVKDLREVGAQKGNNSSNSKPR
jgi:hypothetical protein